MAPRIPGTAIVAFLVLVLAATAASAETITLKDGRVVFGTIIAQTEAAMDVRTEQGVVSLARADVAAVVFGTATGVSSPPAAPAAAAAPAPAAPAQAEDPATTRERLRDERVALRLAEREESRKAAAARDAALRPFLDRGGVGVRVILNPYTSIRAYENGDSGLIKQGAPDFVGGLGVFAEYMGKIVGGGLEVATQFVSVQRIYERTDPYGGTWSARDAKDGESRVGVLLHVWPYLKVRIPTRVVDPYFKLSFGYANYVRSFEGNGPFDGVAISPVFGVVAKINRELGFIAELGYSFTHLEPRYPMEPDNYAIKFHNLAINLGLMYRF